MSHISHNRLRQQLKDIDSLFRTNSPVKEVEIIYNELDKNCDVHSINGIHNSENRRKSLESVRSKSRNSRRGSMSMSTSFDERRESFPEYLENYSVIEDHECNNNNTSLANILESTVISSSPRNKNLRHKSEDRDVISNRANNKITTSETRDWHKNSSISTSNINTIQSSKNGGIDHPSKFPDMLRSTSQNDISRRSSWSYLPNLSSRKASLPLNNKHLNTSINSLSSLKTESRFKLNFPAPHHHRRDSHSDSSNSSSGLQKFTKPRNMSIDSLDSSRRSSRKISDFGLSDDENKIRFNNFQHETMLFQVC